MTTATKAAKDQLRSYIERIERLESEKKELAEDIKSIYAEAKANGYDNKALRAIIRLRKLDTNERQEQEAILDTYMHAIGMAADDAPLFSAIGAMVVDPAARDQVIDAFKRFVPDGGEVILKMGGHPVRLWRDSAGKAHAEDYVAPEGEPPVKPGKKLREPATVLKMVPKGPSPEEIKRIADEAEAASDKKRGIDAEAEPEQPEPAPS